MAPKEKKTKEQIAAAAAAGGKKSRKKWSKGKLKDKLNNAVMFDQEKFDRLSEVTKMKLITPSTICERLKVNVSCARLAIKYLANKGQIRPVCKPHHSQLIYTTAVPKKAEVAAAK